MNVLICALSTESRDYLAAGVVPSAQQTGIVVAAPAAAFAIFSGGGGSVAPGLDGGVRSGDDRAASGTAMAVPAYPKCALAPISILFL